MPDRSFRKEIFPNMLSEPPLTQLEAIASRPTKTGSIISPSNLLQN